MVKLSEEIKKMTTYAARDFQKLWETLQPGDKIKICVDDIGSIEIVEMTESYLVDVSGTYFSYSELFDLFVIDNWLEPEVTKLIIDDGGL